METTERVNVGIDRMDWFFARTTYITILGILWYLFLIIEFVFLGLTIHSFYNIHWSLGILFMVLGVTLSGLLGWVMDDIKELFSKIVFWMYAVDPRKQFKPKWK